MSVPDEVDGIVLECNGLRSLKDADSFVTSPTFRFWRGEAQRRMVALTWSGYSSVGRPTVVPSTDPETISLFADATREHGFKGLLFYCYGEPHWRHVPSINTRPELVEAIREVSREWGFMRPDAELAERSAEPKSPNASTAKLPPWFGEAFMLPAGDRDQYGNPVVERNGNRVDPETGLPYEVWLGKVGMEFLLVPAGDFLMGTASSATPQKIQATYGGSAACHAEEFPQHRVRLTKPFYLAKYEVTKGQWEHVMHSKPWSNQKRVWDGPSTPAEWVAWGDVQSFVGKLNATVGVSLIRLPTEAEWEYACRAGTTGMFHFGDAPADLVKYEWVRANARNGNEWYPREVGAKAPNPWGFYDLHGNVCEWVQDWHASYTTEEQVDPRGPHEGTVRIIRGGNVFCTPGSCRAAIRNLRCHVQPAGQRMLSDEGRGGEGVRLCVSIKDAPRAALDAAL